MFLDYSTRSKTRSAEPYPVVKVPGTAEAMTRDARPEPARRPAIRWSVASGGEDTDQGLDRQEWIRDRPGDGDWITWVLYSVTGSGEGIVWSWWRRGDSNS